MSEPDLLAIGSGGKVSSAPSANEGDPAIWTVLGEAGTDTEGQRAVASTVANRSRLTGEKPAEVVTASDHGYEAWQAHADDLRKRYPVGSPEYEAAKENVGAILSGQEAAPYSYDTFYSPAAQKALGRKPPEWDDGTGKDIGGNVFFTGKYAASDPDLLKIAKVLDQTGPVAETTFDDQGRLMASDTHQRLTPEQGKTYATLAKGGLLDPNAESGTANRPLMARSADDSFAPGQFFIDPNGTLRMEPTEKDSIPNRLMAGLGEGGRDIGLSFARMMPGSDQYSYAPAASARQMVYNAAHDGDVAAQTGRLGGQILGSVPFMLGGEGALGVGAGAIKGAAPVTAPLLDFAAGKAGGNLLLRGASQATRGAVEGGGAAALTSGASDAPLKDQIELGAATGGILRPGLGGLGKLGGGIAGLVEPFTNSGRNRMVDRFIAARAEGGPTALDLTEIVPGSRPTLAQATGNPGIATLERGVKVANPTPFVELRQANDQARELAVDAVRGDRQSLDDLIAHRASSTDPLREAAFADAQPVDPSEVVQHIDAVLKSPAGQRDAVVNALTGIRSKLVNPDGSLQNDPAQLWGIRQAINDMISPLSAGTKADGRLASRELMGLKDALDPVIESGAPGFRDYLSAYTDASKAVDSQQFLQGLKLTDSSGRITLGRVDSALTRIETARAKPGANAAKSVPDHILDRLYALRSDLRREQNSELGRGSGSDTAQKLGTNRLLDTLAVPAALGLGPHGAVAAGALSLGKLAYGSQNPKLTALLTQKLIYPEMAQAALQPSANDSGAVVNYLMKHAVPALQTSTAVNATRNLLLPAA